MHSKMYDSEGQKGGTCRRKNENQLSGFQQLKGSPGKGFLKTKKSQKTACFIRKQYGFNNIRKNNLDP